jgi:uncharacterized membrane protein YphA (DoxX/SURF4 family)
VFVARCTAKFNRPAAIADHLHHCGREEMLARTEERLAFVYQPVVMNHPVRLLGLILLCAVYVQGGLMRLVDFGSAIAEMEQYGLTPARPIAATVILVQLGASAMVLTGFLRWIGALTLAAFTLLATFIAFTFWNMPIGLERTIATNAFFENLGLIGGFLMVAWYSLHKWRRGANDWS